MKRKQTKAKVLPPTSRRMLTDSEIQELRRIGKEQSAYALEAFRESPITPGKPKPENQ